MKKLSILKLLILAIILSLGVDGYAQNPVNWTEKQLLEPGDLANAINTKKDIPVIISVGPGATVPNSVNVGMVNTPEGLAKLKAQLKTIDKDKKIVVYCGCCPFEHCPNVRPAINALKELNFTSYYLLNLPHNIKRDWIDKGYPTT
ncbi:rhodanese-like domain-containing protein [Paracnuella aquatica]|uniref:rhodanese-like domain-containing protein n=1 Tax=Paracnuella aquatica TaxID=2268757 RepID=UPI000DEFFF1E|nr:rhodanese-like domain-containing protein [Paracnuella aquatica]RPD44023.1 rhodanese-like domain-containing protein [Paracnuella aquatica]